MTHIIRQTGDDDIPPPPTVSITVHETALKQPIGFVHFKKPRGLKKPAKRQSGLTKSPKRKPRR